MSAIVATVTCRPAFSRADCRRRRRLDGFPAGHFALLVLLLIVVRPALAAVGSLYLELGRFEHPAFVIDGLTLRIDGDGKAARMELARIEAGGHRWERSSIHCARFRFDAGVLDCRAGTLALPGVIDTATVDFHFDLGGRTGEASLRYGGGESIDLAVGRDGRLGLRLANVLIARLAAALPELASWQANGRLDGRLDYSPGTNGGKLAASATLTDAAFASADGLRAAEKLALDLDLRASAAQQGWNWEARVAWTGGEAYWHPVYLVAGPVVDAAGRYSQGSLSVDRAHLELAGVRTIAATGEFDLQATAVRRLALSVADADLAVIGPRFLAPVLAPAKAEHLRFAGGLSAGIEIENGVLQAIDVALDEAGFSMADKALSFGPLTGVVPWRADSEMRAKLEVGGGRWQKLTLGEFDVVASLTGSRIDVERVAVPLLDGAFVVDELSLRKEATGWHGRGKLVVEPVSMSLLTAVVDLPAMSGTLAASLPNLRVSPGEISVDGALVISVFGGYLQATGLRLLEPFGVAPHLYADVEARSIDLGQLTETFSFGSITGLIDADIRALELAGWRPVQFDARVASSPGSYRRRVSQRAVQNIGALGGAGAVAALQRGFIGLFDTFGYRDIGFSCVLRHGVCMVGGLADVGGAGEGFYLVRGGGVPALNVIGYNRRVDWNELIGRLQRVIASNTAPIVR
ncbi:MAG: hypothetical protein ROZ37_04660 [Aromatoleum sp.]|uniref:hypothetical protein n=1 Tax=Aromatoleum sp. TaxID=2307007 RepID=UPI002895B85B|nr:hypothetical protein [Aromatoleum sp.]MDT3669609.1 hypothetical protein [Aromatoleum sp.]